MTGSAERDASASTSPAVAATARAGTLALRAAISGLLGFAETEEQVLLAARRGNEPGDPSNWAATPLVAHNTQFKEQQLQRLAAISQRLEPPEFGEIDHGSPEVYRACASQPTAAVARESWEVTGALIDAVREVSDDDLCDPARNPWLRGRQLWLQIIVRGYWHPTGHLGDYYIDHGQQGHAVDLASRAVEFAAGLAAPDMARGMASYNLACAQARAGQHEAALAALTEATARNPDVFANAERDPDLSALRSRFR